MGKPWNPQLWKELRWQTILNGILATVMLPAGGVLALKEGHPFWGVFLLLAGIAWALVTVLLVRR